MDPTTQQEQLGVFVAVAVIIKEDKIQVGACFINTLTKRIGMSQFPDQNFVRVKKFLQQHGAQLCFHEPPRRGNELQMTTLRQSISEVGVEASERPSNDFMTADLEGSLAYLSSSRSALLHGPDLRLAGRSTAALIRSLNLLSKPDTIGRFEIYEHVQSDYMILNSSALNAVNLNFNCSKQVQTTLNKHLDHCATSSGRLLLEEWLRYPSTILEEIHDRHQLVGTLYSNPTMIKTLQRHLKSLRLVGLIDKLHTRSSDSSVLTETFRVIACLRAITKSVEDLPAVPESQIFKQQFAQGLTSILQMFELLEETLHHHVDLDALKNQRFAIKPNASNGLIGIQSESSTIIEQMHEEHLKVNADFRKENSGNIDLYCHPSFGWCFKLRVGGQQTATAEGEWFQIDHQHMRTDTLTLLKEQLSRLEETQATTEAGILDSCISEVRSQKYGLAEASRLISKLDVITSFAHAARNASIPYTRPTMTPAGGNCVLTEARHPILEAEENFSFVSNDIRLDRESSRLSIITGPNMGGKSTFLRQLAMNILMAQAGSFVACREAEISVFDGIFARVGGTDYQSKGVSTFGAEMHETSQLLKTASTYSLVLIDELGRGTHAAEGVAIARATCEYLVNNVKSLTLFATHFHDICTLSRENSTVTNLCAGSVMEQTPSCEPRKQQSCQRSQVILTYKIRQGYTEDSFGLNVAQSLGFPTDIIRRASLMIELSKLPSQGRTIQDDALIQVLRQWYTDTALLSSNQKLRALKERVQSNDMLLHEILNKI